jgi:Protein of unknown function (DUF2892)
MKFNVGTTDRVLRIIAGLAILGLGYFYGSWLGLIGIVPILTGIVRFCPAYLPFNISTCEVKAKN